MHQIAGPATGNDPVVRRPRFRWLLDRCHLHQPPARVMVWPHWVRVLFSCAFSLSGLLWATKRPWLRRRKIETFSQTGSSKTPKCFLATNEKIAATASMLKDGLSYC